MSNAFINTDRRQLLHLAAASTAAWALPGHSLAAVTERSGSPDRLVTHKTFWGNTLSCDNAAVPVSERSSRLATLADFGGSPQCTMLKNSMEGPFFFCTMPVKPGPSGSCDVIGAAACERWSGSAAR